MPNQKPCVIPSNPCFSCGPCAKRPGWSLERLSGAMLGRSHRAPAGRAKLREALDLTRELLRLPANYRIAITPASDTGAVEMALWSLLGRGPVDVAAFDSFSNDWAGDISQQLRLPDVRCFSAP